jgi:hypothetical protein
MRATETVNTHSSTLFFSTISEELLAFVSAASKASPVLDKPLARTAVSSRGIYLILANGVRPISDN